MSLDSAPELESGGSPRLEEDGPDLGLPTGGLTALAALMGTPGVAVDAQRLMDAVVRGARELLGADASTLLMLDDDGAFLRVIAADGLDRHLAERLSTDVGRNLAGIVAETGLPLRSSDILSDKRTSLAEVCEACHIRSGILVPLAVDGKVLGVLSAVYSAPRHLSARDEFALQLLGNQAAVLLAKSAHGGTEHDEVVRLASLLEELGRENDVMRRVAAVREQLLEVALAGVSITELLAAVTDLVPVHLSVVNQFGAPLAAKPPDTPTPPGTPLPTNQETTTDADTPGEPTPETAGPGPEQPVLLRELEQLRSCCANGEGDITHRVLDSEQGTWELRPLCNQGELLGALVVGSPDELDRFHVLVLDELTRMLAAELAWDRRVVEVEVRASGNIVGSVLTEDGWGAEAASRAALLGNDLGRLHCVVVVQRSVPSGPPDERLAPRALLPLARRAASRAGLQVLVGEVDDQVVLLLGAWDRDLHQASVNAYIGHLVDELSSRVGDGACGIGVSAVPADLSDGPASLAQARQAAAVCRLKADSPAVFFDDVQIIASLIDITKQDAVRRYIDRTIGELLAYDRRKNMDLTHTLETYLDCSGVARHAAKMLYLHPHSLRYRLRRIVEIQGLDLEDPMARLSAHLAVKLRSLVDTQS